MQMLTRVGRSVRRSVVGLAVSLAVAGSGIATLADEPGAPQPVTLDTAERPAASTPDEPLAEQYSLEAAVHFLDSASLDWQKSRNCMTCHTNYLYLIVRPAVGADNEAHRAVRNYAERLVTERWAERGPRWDAEVVMSAMTLAYNDRLTSGRLSPVARQALDRMWTVQQEDGGFDWLKCEWPPMESDDDFGAPMAALAALVAPDDYALSPAAEQGLEKLRGYLASQPPPSLHHAAMWLWADSFEPGVLLTAAQRDEVLGELFARQRPDGGWALPTLGDWTRHDGQPQDTDSSDGYATGLVLYIARVSGVAADDERPARGAAWLHAHQRASGRWFTRSLWKDNHHFLSHAGTAWAILGLAECEQLVPSPNAGEQARAGR